MQTVNLLTIELQLRVERSNNLLSLFFTKKCKKFLSFPKTRFKVFFGWLILARFFIFPSFSPFRSAALSTDNLSSACSYFPE